MILPYSLSPCDDVAPLAKGTAGCCLLYTSVTKAEVIKTASDMADRNGLHNVSLKAIAENLGIRTPVSYTHLDVYKRQV